MIAMIIVATLNQASDFQISVLMEIHISPPHPPKKKRKCPKKYTNTVSYISLFSRMTPATSQLIEFCLPTENSVYQQKTLMSATGRQSGRSK